MAETVKSLKGVASATSKKLRAHGITSTTQLLAAAMDPNDRRQLADALGLQTSDITEAVNRADLSRIKGVSTVYANLLENSGVDTVKELAVRVPANLHAKLTEVNTQRKLTSRVPPLPTIEGWITQSKHLAK